MKKNFKALLATLLIICMAPTSCIKDSDGNNIAIPDIGNFTIEAVSAWKAGFSALVSIASTTLADGEYTVIFDLTGANMQTGLNAVLSMAGGHGQFSLPNMSNDNGETNVVIRSIRNSAGGTANISSGNTYTFSDSTGLMTGTVAGAAYRATHVDASWLGAGSILSIHAVKWTPLTPITLYVDNWNGAPTTISFNEGDATAFLGGASYSTPGAAHLARHGTISVTAVTPLITGTFTFKSEDSSVVTGSFSCPHP